MGYGLFENIEANELAKKKRKQILAAIHQAETSPDWFSAPAMEEPFPGDEELKSGPKPLHIPPAPKQQEHSNRPLDENDPPLVKFGHISHEGSEALANHAKDVNRVPNWHETYRYESGDPERDAAVNRIRGVISHPDVNNLFRGIRDWTGGGWDPLRSRLEDIHSLHENGKSISGDIENRQFVPQAASMYEAWRQAPNNSPELHRGVLSRKSPEEIEDFLTRNPTVDEPFASWSEKPYIANSFGTTRGSRNLTPLIFHLPEGTQSLHIAPHSSFEDEAEWLTRGPFSVEKMERKPHLTPQEFQRAEREGSEVPPFYGTYYDPYDSEAPEDVKKLAEKLAGITKDEDRHEPSKYNRYIQELNRIDRPTALHVHLRPTTPEEKSDLYKKPEKPVMREKLSNNLEGEEGNIIPFPKKEDKPLDPEPARIIRKKIKKYYDSMGIIDDH